MLPSTSASCNREIGIVKSSSEDESIYENNAFSGAEDEDDELGSSISRVYEESEKSDGSGGSDIELATAPGLQVPGQVDVHAGAESLLSADSLASRAFEMLEAGSSEPWGSGLPPATPRCAQHTHWPPSPPHPLPHVPRPPTRAVP